MKKNLLFTIIILPLLVSCVPTQDSIEKEYHEIWGASLSVVGKVENHLYDNYAELLSDANAVYKKAKAFERKCENVDISSFTDTRFVKSGLTMTDSLSMIHLYSDYPKEFEFYTSSVINNWDLDDKIAAEKLFGFKNRKKITLGSNIWDQEIKNLYIYSGIATNSYELPETLDSGSIPIAYYEDEETGEKYYPGDSLPTSNRNDIIAVPMYTISFIELPYEYDFFSFSLHDSVSGELTKEDFGEEYLSAVNVSVTEDDVYHTYITIPEIPRELTEKLYEDRLKIEEFEVKERKYKYIKAGYKYRFYDLLEKVYDGAITKGFKITLKPILSEL